MGPTCNSQWRFQLTVHKNKITITWFLQLPHKAKLKSSMAMSSSLFTQTHFKGCPTSFAHHISTHVATAEKLLMSPLTQQPGRFHSIFRDRHHHFSWLGQVYDMLTTKRTRRLLVGRVSSFHDTLTAATSSAVVLNHLDYTPSSYLFLLAESTGYSVASYYTSLGLFVISVPGLWSLIKRSVKSKIVQKTFIREAQANNAPNQVAGEILSFLTRNNFSVVDRGETITFEGMMVPSRGQAALLTFCTCISLASVALVLTITFPEFGNNWFWITTLSPLAGVYYWTRASRKEQIKVKMMVGDDGKLSEVIVQGDDQEVEKMRKELQLSEKGMVYVKGIFER